MNVTRKIILLLIAQFFYLTIMGQYRPQENFPSPGVASLGQYGNIPVSLFTGQPNISIPIYEVKEGDLSLPVLFNYSLSSVKPNRRSGWVGLGWNLSAGGYITRNVRGIYDENQDSGGTSHGFYGNYQKLQDITNSTLAFHQENFLDENVSHENTYELMTDEYSFQFGKYSGNFYLDEHGQWIVVSDDDIKIEFDASTGFRNLSQLRPEIKTNNWSYRQENNRFFDIFTLITPDGVRYTFGGKNATEYSISYYNRNQNYLIPTTWFLTKIESTRGYHIDLEYEADLPICEIMFSAFSSFIYINQPDPSSGLFGIFNGTFLNPGDISYVVNNTSGRNKLSGYLIFPVYLKKITSSYVTVNLHSALESVLEQELSATANSESLLYWDDNQSITDPITGQTNSPYTQFKALLSSNTAVSAQTILTEKLRWRILRGISITPIDEDYTKTYYLEYNKDTNRRCLTKIAERKGGYNPVETQIAGGGTIYFKYTTPPADGYNPKDYSFTYNTVKKFPRYIFASTDHWGYYNGYTSSGMPTEGERSYSESLGFDEQYYSTKQPSYDLEVSKAATLKEIIYPMGGKTVFEYQQNRYSKIVPENPTVDLLTESGRAGGVCINEMKNYDQNNQLLQTKRYFYTDAIPSNSYYSTSGILQAKKKYVQNYSFQNGYMSFSSDGGFLTTSLNRNDSHISYSSVIEATYDSSENMNGYTLYRYSNYDTDIWGERHNDDKPVASNINGESYYIPVSSKSMERGKLLTVEHFNSNSKIVKRIKSKYQKTASTPLKTLYQEKVTIRTGTGINDYSWSYIVHLAPTYTYRYVLQQEIESEFDVNGNLLTNTQKNYTFNPQNLIEDETIIDSKGNSMKTAHYYPADFINNSIYTSMVQKHILSPIIQKNYYKNNDWIKKEIIEYKDWGNGLYAPEYVKQQINTQSSPEIRTTYHRYDEHANPVCFTTDEKTTIILWNDKGLYPLMGIENLSCDKITDLFTNTNGLIPYFETEEKECNVFNGEISDWNNCTLEYVDLNGRKKFLNTGISSYYYIPTIGMKKSIDPRGITTYYDYDVFGRLIRTYIIENGTEKTIQSYDYHYRNQ